MNDPNAAPRPAGRRTVVRSAVWTAPTITAVAAAPAFAASCGGGTNCPDLSLGSPSGTAGTGGTSSTGRPSTTTSWTFSATNNTGWVNSNGVGYVTSGGVTVMAVGSAPNVATRTVTFTAPVTLHSTCTYKLTFGQWVYWDSNYYPPPYSVHVGATLVTTGTIAPQPTTGFSDLGLATYDVPSGASGSLTWSVEFSRPGASTSADQYLDYMFYSPSLTCA